MSNPGIDAKPYGVLFFDIEYVGFVYYRGQNSVDGCLHKEMLPIASMHGMIRIKCRLGYWDHSIHEEIHYGFSEDTVVYPGHGENAACRYMFKHNPDIRAAIE